MSSVPSSVKQVDRPVNIEVIHPAAQMMREGNKVHVAGCLYDPAEDYRIPPQKLGLNASLPIDLGIRVECGELDDKPITYIVQATQDLLSRGAMIVGHYHGGFDDTLHVVVYNFSNANLFLDNIARSGYFLATIEFLLGAPANILS